MQVLSMFLGLAHQQQTRLVGCHFSAVVINRTGRYVALTALLRACYHGGLESFPI